LAYIDYKDNLFWGVGTFEERTIWKAAGFEWSSVRRAWTTREKNFAIKVKGVT
jgi:hypothetical protein